MEQTEAVKPAEHMWTKDFALVWQGQLVSTLGDAAYSIALGFWVLKATGSTALMGSLMAASTLPGVLVSPFAGVLIDRINRKPLLICMDIIRGICMALVAAAAFTDHIAVWMVFAAGILLSVCGAFFTPGVNSAVPDLVSKGRIANANSAMMAATTGSNMLGNVAGGFLYQAFGAPAMFLFDGLSFLFSGGSLAFVKIKKAEKQSEKDFLGDMREGFGYMWHHKGLRYMLIIAAVMNFFSFVAIVDFLPLFQRTPSLGAGRYGLAMGLFMAGAMGGFVFGSAVNIPAKRRFAVFEISGFVSCAAIIIGINMSVFAAMLPFIILGGFFNSILNVILLSAIQTTTPAQYRGKTLAFLNMTTQCLTPFAMALGGVLAAFLPIRLIISASFSTVLLIMLPFMFIKSFIDFISYETNGAGEEKAAETA